MHKYEIVNGKDTQTRSDIMQAMQHVRSLNVEPQTIAAITNGLLRPGARTITAGGITVSRIITTRADDKDICRVLDAMAAGETKCAGPWHAQVNHYRGVDSLYAVHTLSYGHKEVMRYSETAGALVLNFEGYEDNDAITYIAACAMARYMDTWHAEVTDYDGLGIWCAGVYYHMFDRRTAFIVLSNGKILID